MSLRDPSLPCPDGGFPDGFLGLRAALRQLFASGWGEVGLECFYSALAGASDSSVSVAFGLELDDALRTALSRARTLGELELACALHSASLSLPLSTSEVHRRYMESRVPPSSSACPDVPWREDLSSEGV